MGNSSTWINTGRDEAAESRITLLNADSPLQKSGSTDINDGTSGRTQLNNYGSPVSRRRRSDRRPAADPEEAVVDTASGSVIELRPGYQLRTSSGRVLSVEKRLGNAKDNGEADVFLCTEGISRYVIKVFRRNMHNMEKKFEAFRKVNSRYIAPIIDHGLYADRYFEMYHYYPCGSLADEIRTRGFSSEELMESIVPQLANAIHDLHSAGIYHRDIKPGNIMWADASRKQIVLIDFGLSSIIRDPSTQKTIMVSQIGGTRAYEAPEVHDGLYVEESDYFSMGIVLYELFCRKPPVAVYTYRISRPEGMDQKLYNLILGLTYLDVKNRNNKKDPNRRWTFDEIRKWYAGEDLPLPGTAQIQAEASERANPRSIPDFFFMGKKYGDIDSLCLALGTDWENGKRCILRDERNALLQHLRRYGTTNGHAVFASQIDDIINNNAYTPDQKLLHVIMDLCPRREYIASPLGCFASPADLGKRLIACMRSESAGMRNTAAEAMGCLLSTKELSDFAIRHRYTRETIEDLRWFESQPSTERWKRQKESVVCELAYFLSGDPRLDLHLRDGSVFSTVDELKAYLVRYGKGDPENLYGVCKDLLDGEHQLKPQVYGWLRQQGCPLEGFNE